MSTIATTAFTSEASGAKRKGETRGKLGGNLIRNIEAAFQAIKNFTAGLPAKAIGLIASACKQEIQVGPKMNNAPFAVPLHMMGPSGTGGGGPPPRRHKTSSEDE